MPENHSLAPATGVPEDDDDLLEFLDGPEHHDEHEAGNDLPPWRILIVDDDADVHKAPSWPCRACASRGCP